MPTLHVPGDRPPRSEHHIGVILHVVAAGHLAYRHVVGRVFFKAVADDFPIRTSPLVLATRPQASAVCIFATFASLSWLKRLLVLLWTR